MPHFNSPFGEILTPISFQLAGEKCGESLHAYCHWSLQPSPPFHFSFLIARHHSEGIPKRCIFRSRDVLEVQCLRKRRLNQNGEVFRKCRRQIPRVRTDSAILQKSKCTASTVSNQNYRGFFDLNYCLFGILKVLSFS